jgi:predicted Zn finger-like uncharacterized protein
MSLAARCPSCGTVFRVVQDQLRVSEGWVRCGRCSEVFNAIESLVDIDAETAPRAPKSTRGERVMEDLAQTSGVDVEVGVDVDADQDDDDRQRPYPSAYSPPPPASLPPLPQRAIEAEAAASAASTVAAVPEPTFDTADLRAEPPEPPTFVRQADRAARWRRPGVRAALGVVVVVSTLFLSMQAVFEYRDGVAARWPGLQPLLASVCDVTGCRIEAPRSIESIAVESSGLVRVDNSALYRLSVVLRNRAALALTLPSIELTLTDTQGALIARRVINAVELNPPQLLLPAAGELTLQGMLSASERPISGYTIEIFYP